MKKRAMPKRLGKKLKAIREAKGLSQRQLVGVLNYTATPLRSSQISQYEQNQREPTMMLVLSYAKLAGIPMDVLVDDKFSVKQVKGMLS